MANGRICAIDEVKEGEVFEFRNHIAATKWLDYYIPNSETALFAVSKGYVRAYPDRLNQRAFDIPKYNATQVRVLDANELQTLRVTHALTENPRGSTGADPEIFVINAKTKRLIPAFKFLPAQKEAKAKYSKVDLASFNGNQPDAFCYRDGFAAESYVAPSHCHAYLADHIRAGLSLIYAQARQFDPAATLSMKNTYVLSAKTLNDAPEDDVQLGCKPSLNAYGENMQLPTDGRTFRLRFAGGHVHFGGLGAFNGKPVDDEMIVNMVKGCDILAAIPSVAVFKDFDTHVRRQTYGRAGEYRRPKYGLEYRTLSNAWLGSPQTAHLFWNLCRAGLKVGRANLLKAFDTPEEKVQEIINFCDVKGAKEFVSKHISAYAALLQSEGSGTTANNTKALLRVVEAGIQEIQPDFGDLVKHWHLTDSEWMTHSNGEKSIWGSFSARIAQKC